MEELKFRLRRALTDKGMTQQELADKTGISKASISQYLSGYATPKKDRLQLLANALDVNSWWLAGYSETEETLHADETGVRPVSQIEVMSDEELIREYHKLSRSSKINLKSYIEALLTMQEELLDSFKREYFGE